MFLYFILFYFILIYLANNNDVWVCWDSSGRQVCVRGSHNNNLVEINILRLRVEDYILKVVVSC